MNQKTEVKFDQLVLREPLLKSAGRLESTVNTDDSTFTVSVVFNKTQVIGVNLSLTPKADVPIPDFSSYDETVVFLGHIHDVIHAELAKVIAAAKDAQKYNH